MWRWKCVFECSLHAARRFGLSKARLLDCGRVWLSGLSEPYAGWNWAGPLGAQCLTGRSLKWDLNKKIIADSDAYCRASAKPDGFRYCEYIWVKCRRRIDYLSQSADTYGTNQSNIWTEPPKRYLGLNVERVTRPQDLTGQEHWSFLARSYVKNAVENVCVLLLEERRHLNRLQRLPSQIQFTDPRWIPAKCVLKRWRQDTCN